jgi:hypothetical protein
MLMATHPIRVVDQRPDHLFVQSSCRSKVDVFDASGALQTRISKAFLQRSVLPPVPLTIYQQREAFFETELCRLWIFLLLCECFGHAAHAHGV